MFKAKRHSQSFRHIRANTTVTKMTSVEVNPPSTYSQVKLPDIQTQSIYTGRFKDRNSNIRAAGKLTATSDSAHLCMEPQPRPDSPDVVKKFRASMRPDAGKTRVFYGKAHDPHLIWARDMTHGLHTHPSVVAGNLLNPQPVSRFQQKKFDKKESIYASHQRAPLGTSHDQRQGMPANLNPINFTFGIQTQKDGSAGELVNPDKSPQEINEEYEAGRELYRRTHFDFQVGEQCNRAYAQPSFNKKAQFGIPTPHDNDGRHVRTTLRWRHDEMSEKAAPIVSKRVDNFRERTQPQLGKVHDPIKDTLNVPSDHTFGILVKPDEYGAGDLMHARAPQSYLRGKDRERGLIGAMRQHLKKQNYHNFQDLMSAFAFYDKDKSGKINMNELREVCIKFNLPVEPELLEQLMDYCDQDCDGQINYTEFANFLNWKDKLPAGITSREVQSAPAGSIQEDGALTQESTPRRLAKQIDRAIGDHRTSSSCINAVVGPGGISTRVYRTYGVPTIRTDVPAPRIRQVHDRTNYGDESNAYGLTNPSIYSTHGVYEKDFLLPRPKEEIRDVFTQIGVKMNPDTFEDLYQVAASRHPKGEVSVESFRNVLDECQAVSLQKAGIAA